MSNNFSRVSHKDDEQAVFRRSQMDWFVRDHNLASTEINAQIAHSENGV